jgi:hypothetical protein
MKQYRIVAEPRRSGGEWFIVQSKGCGPFSLFWWSDKQYTPFGSNRKLHSTLKEAEAELKKLRAYDCSSSRVVKTYKCGCP